MSLPVLRCWVGGVAVLGPGLPGWTASEAILAGEAPWTPAELAVPPPAMLPATERRRTSLAVRLALAAAAEAASAEGDTAALETVFASSNGDGAVVGAILETLTDPAGAISPTQFHNSVHNAAAGYWGIGAGSTSPSISIGGHDDTVAAGLLQAAAAVATRRRRVLLCAYDAPLPPPLDAVRRTTIPFAAALVLLPKRDASARAALAFHFRPDAPPRDDAAPADPLDALTTENPAARALPLLRALAARRAAALHLPLLGDASLEIELAPC
ncbi:MAG TPA: beta-ketoacyl synthase chain length factor [Acetobacteraceae bacterium]|nr:beta-ketoacyl synthase chain length factor [Acetobacteraceae bacterium]